MSKWITRCHEMKGNIDGSIRWWEHLRTDEKQQPWNACGIWDVEDMVVEEMGKMLITGDASNKKRCTWTKIDREPRYFVPTAVRRNANEWTRAKVSGRKERPESRKFERACFKRAACHRAWTWVWTMSYWGSSNYWKKFWRDFASDIKCCKRGVCTPWPQAVMWLRLSVHCR